MKAKPIRVLPPSSTELQESDHVLALKCFYCGLQGQDQVFLCNWCRAVFYCAKHYAIHRNKSKCFPYVIEEGSRLKASRDIRAGEIILLEKPGIVAPAQNSFPVCVSCLSKLKNLDEDRCQKCSLPVCSFRCQESTIHQAECKIFSQNKVKTKLIANAPNNFYASIAPIRMLHLKSLGESVEDVWKPLWKLPDHEEERFKVARSDWDVIQLEVVEFLRSRCFLKNEVSEEDLHRLAGIFGINAVTIGNHKGALYGKGLYPIFSIVNHNCVGNAKFKIDTNSWMITMKAQQAIKKGEEISVQYLSTILGTHKRRKRLKSEWYFDCQCIRCQDPTEMETFVSALICEVCEDDFLLPTEPLDYMSTWTCGSCDFFLSATDAEAKVDAIEDELSLATTKRDLKSLETFVQYYSGKILHSNHYLLMLAKRNYLYISRKNLIDLMTKCSVEEQAELKAAFKSKNDLYREFSWIPEKLYCSEAF